MPEIEQYFDSTFVNDVRQRIIQQLHLIEYEECDYHRLVTTDWFIRRHLAWRPTAVDAAVKMVINSLKWRKSMGIGQWSERTFPVEFYKSAACFPHLPDRDGNHIVVLRLKLNKKDPLIKFEFEDLARKYFIYVCENIVNEHHNHGFSIIFDCSDASLSNVDIDMTRFIISTLSNHYAGAVAYCYVYELPWIFNQLWKLVRSWLDSDARKLVRFVNKKDIHKSIESQNLPDYMGGTAIINYRTVPKGAPSIEEVAECLGFKNENEINKIAAYFRKLIAEH